MNSEVEHLEQLADLVSDHVSAMLAYWDKDLVCRFANRAYIDWFGKSKEEMVGRITLPELLGPLYEKNRSYIEAALRGEQQMFERDIPTPGGGIRHSLANYYPDIRDGAVQGFIVHVADVSPLKKLQQELKRTNKIVSKQNERLKNFANVVGHNLKSYSNNLGALLDMLELSEAPEERAQFMSYLKKLSADFNATIVNLADVVKVENQLEVKTEPLNLAQYVRKVLDTLRVELSAADAMVVNEIGENVYVHAIPAYLESIIHNLISNAIKYRNNIRRLVVTIACEDKDGELILRVADNGLGIDLTKHGKDLFGMYKTFHGNADATGLGLYLTRAQVEEMGGRIEVESEPGTGTIFSIYLKKHWK